jgi:hypothetical protein
MTFYRCLCRCHIALGERERSDGVDTSDPIHAASACPVCIDRHVRALIVPPEKPKPAAPQPYGQPDVSTAWQGDGEGTE